MGISGQNVFKGINAQALAAISLFLQYLRYTDFSYIQLEAPQFEDFNLVFNDGRKLICESKDWERNFSFADLKKVLKSILKKNVIGEKDEVLIICSSLDDNLKDKMHAVKYFEQVRQEFKKRGFENNEIQSLSKVKFWEISSKFNEELIHSLFSELINFWLPPQSVKRIVDSILLQKIYKGSVVGSTYTRTQILEEINNLKNETQQSSDYFNDKIKKEKQFKLLEKDINNHKGIRWGTGSVSAFSTRWDLMSFAVDRLKKRANLDLKKWDSLWQLNRVRYFTFAIFDIFENNLHTKQNKKYILDYIKKCIKDIRGFYRPDFFDVDVVKITKKILDDDKNNKFIEDSFEIVKKLITEKRDDIFYLKTQQDSSWERGEVAKLLQEVYKKADTELKEKIYKLIIDSFNLIEDDGEFGHYTPHNIFDILKSYLIEDWNKFEKRIRDLKEVLVKQYEEYYKKFDGWELMGGGLTALNHKYRVWDRHFVMFTIGPALSEYYKEKKEDAWKFILTDCISETKKVSKNRPDFLNRAVITIILDRYESGDGKISEKAFDILREFILSRKGIPHKTDLIYQWLKHRPNLSDDKKWKLLEVSIKKYGMPVNVFVEEIISELAKKNDAKAKRTLKDWLKNPKYYERFRLEMNIAQNIRTIFDSDFEQAVSLFEEFINSEYFINKQDSFEAYEIAILLYDILKKDCERGLKIIKKISEQKTLTKNQQIILCFSLFNYRGNDQSDSIDLVEEVYKKFIDPFLDSLNNDINKIVKKLSFSQAREALVQFAGRLARNKKIKEALRIVRIFIDDPDPYMPGEDPEDPKNEYNEHQRILNGEEPHTITSTRGWCGWVLMGCSVLAGRDYIKELISLTEQLTKDKNWYVKHMACFALSQLAQNRLTVLPDNKEVLFFGKNKEEALERSKQVEEIAFRLLGDIAKASDNVKKAMAKSILTVFDHIRILNEKDASTFVNTFKNFPDEAIAEAAPLFIFFAEFRKDAFRDWKWKTDKYYNDLGPDKYDDKKFKKILLEVIDKIESKQRFSFLAQFEHSLRDLDYKQEDAERLFEIGYKYIDYLAKEYNHDLSNIIYMTIKNEMKKKQYFCKWHALYLKYLEKEREFYQDHFKSEKSMEMYWWPSYYNEDILLLIHQELGKDKFLEAFDIITQFPKELEIYASDKIVSLLEEFSKTNKTAKAIIGHLFEKNPSKYYELRNKWFGNS